jgi:hypothetical protein
MLDDDMKEARRRANVLRQSLPQSVDAAALGVWSKAVMIGVARSACAITIAPGVNRRASPPKGPERDNNK